MKNNVVSLNDYMHNSHVLRVVQDGLDGIESAKKAGRYLATATFFTGVLVGIGFSILFFVK